MTNQLITALDTFVSPHVKTVPNYLDDFVNGDPVACQFVLIKFKIELGRIKLLPEDHG